MKEKIKKKIGIGQPDYDYMDNMDLDGWDWEFVRRNESFREIYSEIKRKCHHFSNGNLLENPKDVFFYRRWWKIEKKFGVNPFCEIREYGAGVPDPDLGYNLLPESIKPLMKGTVQRRKRRKKVRRLSYILNPVKALTSLEIERETNKTWNRQLIEIMEVVGKKYAYQRYLQKILSPDDSANTLYIGVSLKGKRDDIRKEFESLLKKYIKAKSEKGFQRHRTREWKSYLMVWDEWLRYDFPRKKGSKEIAQNLSLNLNTVKERWNKAYFLIHGERFNPQYFKEKNKAAGEQLCAKCEDAKCYKSFGSDTMNWFPCGEYLKLAGKDSQREKSMSSEQFNLTHFGEIEEDLHS